MTDAGRLTHGANRAVWRSASLCWVLSLIAACCRNEGSASSPVSAKAGVSYACDTSHDYRAFEGSAILANVNFNAPRREQTTAELETLTPGPPLWEFQQTPDVRCSTDGFLELRYSVADPEGFSAARNRMTVTIAPGSRLLDPQAHERMRSLAMAADEALTLLRAKTCSGAGVPCDLERNQDPLRFTGTALQYSIDSEFKHIGRHAWFWQSVKDQRQIMRTLFCTTDGRFDVEVLVETMDPAGASPGSLILIPELLSNEYDRRVSQDRGPAQGEARE